MVEADLLKQNLIGEFAPSKSKRFIMEGSYGISLFRLGVNKRFELFRRGAGLYYILRYNMTYEDFFRMKLITRRN